MSKPTVENRLNHTGVIPRIGSPGNHDLGIRAAAVTAYHQGLREAAPTLVTDVATALGVTIDPDISTVWAEQRGVQNRYPDPGDRYVAELGGIFGDHLSTNQPQRLMGVALDYLREDPYMPDQAIWGIVGDKVRPLDPDHLRADQIMALMGYMAGLRHVLLSQHVELGATSLTIDTLNTERGEI